MTISFRLLAKTTTNGVSVTSNRYVLMVRTLYENGTVNQYHTQDSKEAEDNGWPIQREPQENHRKRDDTSETNINVEVPAII